MDSGEPIPVDVGAPESVVEDRRSWLIVAGSLLALTVGSSPLVFVASGVLVPVVAGAFGWTRGTASLAVSAFTFATALAMPLAGRLIDRIGLIRTLCIGVPLFAAALAATSLTPASPAMFIGFYVLLGLLGASLSPLPYAKAISAAFDARRGLAIGIAMAGYGVGSIIIPIIVHQSIDSWGWRATYGLLGGLAGVGGAIAILLIRSGMPRPAEILARKSALSPPEAAGAGAATFVKIAGTLALTSIAVNGVVPNMVTIATDSGLPIKSAVGLLSIVGVSSICGRVLAGWLLDRFHASRVGMMLFAVPLVGLLLIAFHAPPAWLPLAAVAIGVGLGAEVDLMGYVVGRYFGIRRYGEIYGWMAAIFSIGAGVGALLMGQSWDRAGSYAPALMLSTVGLGAAIYLVSSLGPYRFAPRR